MTIIELEEQLQILGLPLAYRQWGEGEEPKLPYILFYRDQSDDFFADNQNYAAGNQMALELYTETKDFYQEELIENLLKNLCIPYQLFEGELETEGMYEVLYEFKI